MFCTAEQAGPSKSVCPSRQGQLAQTRQSRERPDPTNRDATDMLGYDRWNEEEEGVISLFFRNECKIGR